MKRALKSVAFMFCITLLFASMVSGVRELSRESIARNQKLKLQRIILGVLKITPAAGANDRALVKLFRERVRPVHYGGRQVYVGYEPDGRTVRGYAFKVGGPGLWGPIYGMAAVGPQGRKLMGLAFYKHSETPGLGGRISEKWFQEQFSGLELLPAGGRGKIFRLLPAGSGQAPGELDAITGATQTSKAVENFLNRQLSAAAARLRARLKGSK